MWEYGSIGVWECGSMGVMALIVGSIGAEMCMRDA